MNRTEGIELYDIKLFDGVAEQLAPLGIYKVAIIKLRWPQPSPWQRYTCQIVLGSVGGILRFNGLRRADHKPGSHVILQVSGTTYPNNDPKKAARWGYYREQTHPAARVR